MAKQGMRFPQISQAEAVEAYNRTQPGELKRAGREYKGACPNPACDSDDDGFRINPNGRIFCRQCCPSGGPKGSKPPAALEAIQDALGLSRRRADRPRRSPRGIKADPIAPKIAAYSAPGDSKASIDFAALAAKVLALGLPRATEFARSRGIDAEMCRALGWRFAEGADLDKVEAAGLQWPGTRPEAVVLQPVYDADGRPQNLRCRALCDTWGKSRTRSLKGSRNVEPHGIETLDGEEDVLVVEGATDFAAARMAGAVQALGIHGVRSGHDRVVELAREHGCRVTIVFDGDSAGRKGAESLGSKLTAAGLPWREIIPPEGSDLNDVWLSDPGSVKAALDSDGPGTFGSLAVTKWHDPLMRRSWSDVWDVPPIDWLVQGLIARGQIVILAGQPKVGKSSALEWLVATATGYGDSHYLGRAVAQPLRCCIHFPDAGWRAGSRRYKALIPRDAQGVTPLRTDATWDAVLRNAASGEFDLVGIDTLGAAIRDRLDGDGYTDWQGVFQELRSAAETGNCGVLLTHHARKQSTGEPVQDALGSSAIGGGSDAVVLIAKDNKGARTITSSCRDGEDFTRQRLLFAPVRRSVMLAAAAVTSPAKTTSRRNDSRARRAEAETLFGEGLTVPEVSDRTGIPVRTLYRWRE